MYRPKLLVDLDGSLCHPAPYPEIGIPKVEVIRQLDRLREEGYRIYIYTCRDWWQEGQIQSWCALNGLKVDGVYAGKPLGIICDDLSINPLETEGLYGKIKEMTKKMNEDWFKAKDKGGE